MLNPVMAYAEQIGWVKSDIDDFDEYDHTDYEWFAYSMILAGNYSLSVLNWLITHVEYITDGYDAILHTEVKP